jgi:hypothetical protein
LLADECFDGVFFGTVFDFDYEWMSDVKMDKSGLRNV